MHKFYNLNNCSKYLRSLRLFFYVVLIIAGIVFPVQQITAQNNLDNIGLPFTKSVGAYSVRKLSSSYSGKSLKVRRSSDNDSLDIGFTVGGDLDTTALLAFVGTGSTDNGFVTKWYDQSGNGRNVTQTVPLNQPKIITAGVLELNGTRPAIKFGGGAQNLMNPFTSFTTLYPVTISLLGNTSGAVTNGAFVKFGSQAGNAGIAIGIGSSGASGSLTSQGTSIIALKDIISTVTTASPSSTNIIYPASAFTSTTTQEATVSGKSPLTTYLNGSGIALFNSTASPNGSSVRDTVYIGGYNGLNGGFPVVKESEVILFANTPASPAAGFAYNAKISNADRQNLECNQLTYYGILKSSVGANQAICNSFTSAPLGATSPSVGTGRWVQLSGPLNGTTVFSNISDGNATATVNKMGAYVYTWEVSNGSCLAASNVTVTYTFPPTVGINQNICGTLISNSLGGSTPSVGTGTWSMTSGPGNVTFSDVNNGNATATVDADGDYVFRWTITGENCATDYAELAVKYNSSGSIIMPTATLTGSASVCQGSSTNLTVNFTGTAPFNFSYTDGTQIINMVAPTSSILIPVSPSKNSTYNLLTLSDAGCTAQPANLSGSAAISFSPTVTITPDYCSFGGGVIKLDAGSHYSYVWSNGLTTQNISVLQAGTYTVKVKDAAVGCEATGVINVGEELVINGDFSQGNTGFVTEYQAPTKPLICNDLTTALYPEGYFDVKSSAVSTHCNFTGLDHTKPGAGKFMIINGANSLTQIWKTNNIRVKPNTRYYFSAWAMSLNDVGPFAALTFLVNGTQYGSTATLAAGVKPPLVNSAWTRFYGQWDSGSDTAATISIVNTNLTASGNDFGLDDISFSTVPPVPFSANPLGNGGNSFCPSNQLALTANLVGGSSPFTYVWSGPNSFSSANASPVIASPGPLDAGTYTVTVTDYNGCTASNNVNIVTSSPQLAGIAQVPVCSGFTVVIDLTGLVPNTINNIVNYNVKDLANTVILSGTASGVNSDATGIASFSIPGTILTSANNGFSLNLLSISNGSCSLPLALSTVLNIKSVGWVGGSTGNWSQASNWCPGLPTATTSVTIPANTTIYINPNEVAVCKNITLSSPGTVKIIGGKLQISGTVVTTATGKIDAGQGVIEMKSGAQLLSGDNFVGGNISSLVVTNTSTTITGSNLNIVSALLFGNTTADIITNDKLVFGSNDTATARLGQVAVGNIIVGNVTANRYFPQSRAWRLVTSPLSNTGSIFGAWQGGAGYVPGQGMFVTGPNPTGASGNGLDWSGYNNYSMKGWDGATSKYVNVGDTKHRQLSSDSTATGKACSIGYYAFVRGDRQRTPLDNTVYPNGNNTTLSSTGKLQNGLQQFDFTTGAGTFALIGNPYISSVDFSKLTLVNVNKAKFYTYDPSSGSVGTFITMVEDIANPGTFIAVPYSSQTKNIQSSQAFFVEVTGPSASVTFNESNKTTDYNPVLFRPLQPVNDAASFRINLYQKNADQSNLLVDAALEQLMDGLDENVNSDDALKFSNTTENLSIYSHNKYLSVERRPLLTANDTIFLQLSKTTQRSYRFELVPYNINPLLTAFLEDSYTGKSTPISVISNTAYDFSITSDAKSAVTNRFRIVFKQTALGPLPVSFKSIKANKQAGNIAVEWTVESELNIKNYEVEKSTDGLVFVKAGTVAATGFNRNSITYNWLDENPLTGNNFYRVRSIGADGKMDYTTTVLVKMDKQISSIHIYPNPVTDGIIGAQFKNMAGGIYSIKLLNAQGQTILNKTINHTPGTSMEYIQPDFGLLAGIYQLLVTANADSQTINLKVVVK